MPSFESRSTVTGPQMQWLQHSRQSIRQQSVLAHSKNQIPNSPHTRTKTAVCVMSNLFFRSWTWAYVRRSKTTMVAAQGNRGRAAHARQRGQNKRKHDDGNIQGEQCTRPTPRITSFTAERQQQARTIQILVIRWTVLVAPDLLRGRHGGERADTHTHIQEQLYANAWYQSAPRPPTLETAVES